MVGKYSSRDLEGSPIIPLRNKGDPMKYFLIFTAVVSLTQAMATTEKSRVEATLDQMVREKVISAQEAEKAKMKMKAMNEDEWNKLNETAVTAASRMPASVQGREDLEGAQLMQIQDDMKRMIPGPR
jgi:hypothetical protein